MTTKQLKDLILWMKATKVKRFKNADIEFELSDMAFIEELNMPNIKEMPLGGGSDMLDTIKSNTPEEDDEDLFWSTK